MVAFSSGVVIGKSGKIIRNFVLGVTQYFAALSVCLQFVDNRTGPLGFVPLFLIMAKKYSDINIQYLLTVLIIFLVMLVGRI